MATRATERLSAAQLNSATQELVDVAESRVPTLALAYQGALNHLGDTAALRFAELTEEHITAAASWTPPAIDDLVKKSEAQQLARQAAQAEERAILAQMLTALGAELGIDLGLTGFMEQQLLDMLGARADDVAAGAREVVAHTVTDAWIEGSTIQETSSAIRANVRSASGAQAEMLARTDLIGLANGSSFFGVMRMHEIDPDLVPKFKRWLATPDERTRPTHMEAHGQTVPLLDEFDIGGAPLLYPGDPTGPDGEVINCRCTLIYTDSPSAPLTADAALEAMRAIMASVDERPVRAALTHQRELMSWDDFFDETKHPRHGKGTPEGGRFKSKSAASASDQEMLDAWIAGQEEAFELTGRTPLGGESLYTVVPDLTLEEHGFVMGAAPAAKEAVAMKLAEKLGSDPDFVQLAQDYERVTALGFDEPISSLYTREQWMAKPYAERAASYMVSNWALSAADDDRWALMFQQAAADEFGLQNVSGYVKQATARAGPYSGLIGREQQWPTTSDGYIGARKLVRAQYELTQDFFAENGISQVDAYRGMHHPFGYLTPKDWPAQSGHTSITANPLSSYSWNYPTAANFAVGMSPDEIPNSALIGASIPVSRILATPFTGFGSLSEAELIVLGGTDPAYVETFRGEAPSKGDYDKRWHR